MSKHAAPRPLTWANYQGELIISSPNGTRIILKTDEVSGGIHVQQHAVTLDSAALAAVPLGVGVLVLNAGTEG